MTGRAPRGRIDVIDDRPDLRSDFEALDASLKRLVAHGVSIDDLRRIFAPMPGEAQETTQPGRIAEARALLNPPFALPPSDAFVTGPAVSRTDPDPLDMPEPLPNTDASASDGGPEIVEDSKKGDKAR